MRRYERYKDSGVEWLGEVPSHWEVKKMKFLFKDTSIKNKPDETLLSVTQNRGVIPRDWLEERTVMPSGSLETFKFIEKDDFAISLRSFEGGLEICHHDGIISPAYTVLKYNKKLLNNGYYKYLFKCQKFISEMQTSIVGIREGKNISYEELKYSFLPIPQIIEQQKIAQFLDDKTAKIDQAVDLAEKQIALLKEHKQILIQNAVTRGLNPDVPLKDSSVEWIGQVPEHWDIKRFRNLFDFGKGLSITKENLQDEGIPCVNYGEVHSRHGFEVIPERDALKCVDSKYLVFNNSMLNKGDFVFADTSEDIEGSGNFTYLNSSTRIFAGYHTVITRLKITAIHRYIAYYFDSLSFRNQIRNKVKGVKVFSITQSILKGTFVLLPNLKEQQQIADYLDTQTAKIDQAIALKTAHIEKLKEYKSVLINDVVTGKVRV